MLNREISAIYQCLIGEPLSDKDNEVLMQGQITKIFETHLPHLDIEYFLSTPNLVGIYQLDIL